MYKVSRVFLVCAIAISIFINGTETLANRDDSKPLEEPVIAEELTTFSEETTTEIVETVTQVQEEVEEVIETPTYEGPYLSDEDIELIALVTMAEAEGECEEGKRLVIDTILNRMEHERFPDTAYDVIYQKNQFTSMWNGRVDRVKATPEVIQLVKEELESRTNHDVIFFRMYHYAKWGTPLFKVGCHYFSSY